MARFMFSASPSLRLKGLLQGGINQLLQVPLKQESFQNKKKNIAQNWAITTSPSSRTQKGREVLCWPKYLFNIHQYRLRFLPVNCKPLVCGRTLRQRFSDCYSLFIVTTCNVWRQICTARLLFLWKKWHFNQWMSPPPCQRPRAEALSRSTRYQSQRTRGQMNWHSP